MDQRFDLRLGDSREVLRSLPDCSVDSVVCDPPYALESIVKRFGSEGAAPAQEGTDGAFARLSHGFMGSAWDTGETAFSPVFWAAVLRVLKPGGWLVAFGGTRTYHRLATAIENAGFLIDDQLAWCFGVGLPKSHKPSLYIERTLCWCDTTDDKRRWRYVGDDTDMATVPPFRHPAANEWWGWGTALKPAWEPICLAQRPMIGTIAENVLAHGVGVLNIDACRVEVEYPDGDSRGPITRSPKPDRDDGYSMDRGGSSVYDFSVGRWPANLIHDGSDEVLAAFPAAPGQQRPASSDPDSPRVRGIYGEFGRADEPMQPRGDSGSAARFFYCSKASKRDREEGLEDFQDQVLARSNAAQTKADDGDVVEAVACGFNAARIRKNDHPTVKPTALMQWLCRLITPPGGVVLDPFMGSGSTGKAAMLEGFRFVGIEREEPYFRLAEGRVAFGLAAASGPPAFPAPKPRPKPPAAPVPQLDLFAAE